MASSSEFVGDNEKEEELVRLGAIFGDPKPVQLTGGVLWNLRFELKLLFSRQSNFHLQYDFSSIQLPLTRTISSSFYFINPSLLKKKLF